MNIEPASKSIGFFAIYTEAYKLTTWKISLSSQIPFTISSILLNYTLVISALIDTETSPGKESSRQIPYDVIQLILMMFFIILLISIISTFACFYTSKDISFQKVIGVLRKCCWRLIFTFFWAFFMGAMYTPVALGLLLWFFRGVDDLRLLDPHVTGFYYMLIVWNVAVVVPVLENGYGIKGLAKSMRLSFSKIWISCAVYGLLEIAFTGIILPFCYLVVFGNNINLVGRVYLRIGCHLLTVIWIHYSLVRLTVVYLVCKSYHNEDIPTAAHAVVFPIIYLIWLVIKTYN